MTETFTNVPMNETTTTGTIHWNSTPAPTVCPTCGTCPTCGKRLVQTSPYTAYPFWTIVPYGMTVTC